MTATDAILLVPYATARLDDRLLGAGDDGYACRVPHAIVDPAARDPLRLNDAPYDFAGRAPPAQATGESDPLELLRTRVADLCDLFAAAQRRFLDAYFAFAVDVVERHRETLEARLAPFGGLYAPRDFVYSALAPLPRAWLPAPSSPCDRARAAADFVPADFAFWTGDRLVALDVTAATPTAVARARETRLRAAGVEVVTVADADLRAAGAATLRDRLPADFLHFWEGEPFPAGPFRASRR